MVAMSPTPQVGFASIPMAALYSCLFVQQEDRLFCFIVRRWIARAFFRL
jgi:hypothetical protein